MNYLRKKLKIIKDNILIIAIYSLKTPTNMKLIILELAVFILFVYEPYKLYFIFKVS
jgi:hypothetical protein